MSDEKENRLYTLVADCRYPSASLRFPENGASAGRMAKGYWEPPHRKYIDENLVRVQREARERMTYLLEHGSEEEFVEALKAWLGEKLTPERLQHCIMQFHASRAEKRGL